MSRLLNSTAMLRRKVVPAGTELVRQGEKSAEIYVLAEGQLEVLMNGQRVCVVDKPGTVLGEIASVLEAERTATLKAVTECTLHMAGSFTEMFKINPDSCLEVARVMARKLVETNDYLAALRKEFKEQSANLAGTDATKVFLRRWEEVEKQFMTQYFDGSSEQGEIEETRAVGEGEILIEEGSAKGPLYVLRTGSVVVTKHNVALCEVKAPGAIFGEIAQLLNIPHTATVRAKEPSTFTLIPNLAKSARLKPALIQHVAHLLAKRVVLAADLCGELKDLCGGDVAPPKPSAETQTASKLFQFWARVKKELGTRLFELRTGL